MRKRRDQRVAVIDLIREAIGGLAAFPVRSALTIAGISVGLAALVAAIGISQSTGGQIALRFFETQSNYLIARSAEGDLPQVTQDAVSVLEGYEGVNAASLVSEYRDGVLALSRAAPDSPNAVRVPTVVMGADNTLFDTIGASFSSGRSYDQGHQRRGARVAVIGGGLAARLGVTTVAGGPVVIIGDTAYSVIGIIEDVAFYSDVLDSLILPPSSAKRVADSPTRLTVPISTHPNSTFAIAGVAAQVLAPATPGSMLVSAASRPPDVATAISSDIDALTIALTSVGVLVAATSVTAIMTINVTERTSEIGLRRSLGAARAHIATQFILESIAVGAVGGLVGSSLGLLLVTSVASLRDIQAILSPAVPYAAFLIGVVVGTLAGIGPALRAARMAPERSLRA